MYAIITTPNADGSSTNYVHGECSVDEANQLKKELEGSLSQLVMYKSLADYLVYEGLGKIRMTKEGHKFVIDEQGKEYFFSLNHDGSDRVEVDGEVYNYPGAQFCSGVEWEK